MVDKVIPSAIQPEKEQDVWSDIVQKLFELPKLEPPKAESKTDFERLLDQFDRTHKSSDMTPDQISIAARGIADIIARNNDFGDKTDRAKLSRLFTAALQSGEGTATADLLVATINHNLEMRGRGAMRITAAHTREEYVDKESRPEPKDDNIKRMPPMYERRNMTVAMPGSQGAPIRVHCDVPLKVYY